jgi:hypothetical protein
MLYSLAWLRAGLRPHRVYRGAHSAPSGNR